MEGYIKLHRTILDNPVVCKDAEYFTVWTYLLLNATHTECDMIFNGKRIMLKAGQLITGRKSISERFNISESKVQRVMKKLEIEQQIEQQTCSKNRLISIVNWNLYQSTEHQVEQQVNNNRTTSEQQVNTNKNVKNDKNVKNNTIDYHLIIDQYNNRCSKLPTLQKLTDKRKASMRTFLKEYTLDEMLEVFDRANESEFLTNGKWSCNFDWIINKNNAAKILEGNYKNNKQTESQSIGFMDS